MNATQLSALLRQLHGAYRTEITDDIAALWSNVFGDADFNHTRDAVAIWINNESKFPTPADIRGLMRRAAERSAPNVIELPTGRERSGPDGGFQTAYTAYVRECERHGREPKPYETFVGKLPLARSTTRVVRRDQ